MKIRILILMFLPCWMSPASGAENVGLTPQEVRHWLQLRIEEARLQNEMRANAANEEDLPVAFFRRVRAHMDDIGYGYDRYRRHGERITQAERFLRDEAGLREGLEQRKAEVERVCSGEMESVVRAAREATLVELQDAAGELPPEMRAALEEAMVQMSQPTSHDNAQCEVVRAAYHAGLAQLERAVTATGRDWDGVRPWLNELEQFSQWYAGNRTEPPAL